VNGGKGKLGEGYGKLGDGKGKGGMYGRDGNGDGWER
jgi:hypothetical protein